MLITFVCNLIIVKIIFGYSFLFKKILFNNGPIQIKNIDFIYGIFIIIFFSIFANFFFPLNVFTIPFSIVGVILFIYAQYKKVLKINYWSLLPILFFSVFIAFYNGNNVDSPMYHLQILKWLNQHKVTFGLSNLEIRYGMNSSWHNFIALMDINFSGFSIKYFISSIILALFINEIFERKKISISNIYLYLSASYLLFFSLIHPFKNGIILNHLGNPEIDIISNIFFIISIYIFLDLNLKKYKDENLVFLLFIIIFLCITSRIAFLPLILFPIYIIIKEKSFLFNKLNLFIFVLGIMWLVKSFILSGCFVFPSKITCFDTIWSTNIKEVVYHALETMSYNRDNPFRENYKDFNYTIYSYNWLIPWLKNYFLETALLTISFSILLVSIILLFFSFLRNYDNNKKINYIYILIVTVFFLIYCIWFLSPEIRYISGLIISTATLFIVFVIYEFKFSPLLNYNLIRSSLIVICILLSYKNFKYFNLKGLLIFKTRVFDYSHIYKVGKYDGYDVYGSNIWQCAEFKEICLNKPKKKYSFLKKNGYLFILSH